MAALCSRTIVGSVAPQSQERQLCIMLACEDRKPGMKPGMFGENFSSLNAVYGYLVLLPVQRLSIHLDFSGLSRMKNQHNYLFLLNFFFRSHPGLTIAIHEIAG